MTRHVMGGKAIERMDPDRMFVRAGGQAMKRRLIGVGGSLGIAALVIAATTWMVAAALQQAPAGVIVAGSPSNFESGDGNMTVDFSNSGANDTDWNCFKGQTTNCKVTTGATFITADASGEIQWVSGQKFDTLCPATNIGNNPPKDEFVNIAQFSETAANLDEYFYGATIRSTANGNASGDVEFDQNQGATPTSMPCRVAGDLLMAYDFLNGGTQLNFHLLTWIDSSNPNAGGNAGTCFVKSDPLPCWGANVIIPSGQQFNGKSNQSPITAAANLISGVALPVNQFSEFGINLSQALNLSGQCLSFPQQTWESRSSGASFTSNPQDLEINQRTINNCGTVTIIKHTDPGGLNQSIPFSDNIKVSGATAPATFSLNDASGATNTEVFHNVVIGSYVVTETQQSGFTLESLTCTATGSGSSGSQDAPGSLQADITVGGGGSVTCTYVNK